MSGPRVAFQTLGCRSNFADTTDLQAQLVEKGGVPCEHDQAPDVFVINSCTVTNSADKEVHKLIRKAKAQNPDARIVVTGCMAETDTGALKEEHLADAVVGPGRSGEVLRAIFNRTNGEFEDGRTRKDRRNRVSDALLAPLSPAIPSPGESIGSTSSRARFHLRVQEGCENHCTFCIIPETRGSYHSRPMSDILEDIQKLSALGYEEIVLTGTHLGGYGEDIGTSLLRLLQRLVAEEVNPRIRLSSIDPNDLSEEIIDLLSNSGRIFCQHLHVCVQSFSHQTLKRMCRKYSLDEAVEKVRYIHKRMPNCCIGSDVIVGFPGESREELDRAMDVFLGLPFSYLHVFPFSERSGTAATRLDGVVDVGERRRRAARWRALSQRKKKSFLERFLGQPLEVIVEQVNDNNFLGTSREFVSIKASTSLLGPHPEEMIGQRVSVRAASIVEDELRVLCE